MLRTPLNVLILTLCALLATSATAAPSMLKPTVESIDLNQYAGKWFEISRIENEFQIGCRGATATYTVGTDNKSRPFLDVVNECHVGEDSQQRLRAAHGRAWPAKNSGTARLQISFVHFGFWWKMFSNDYWVLDVGPLDESGHYTWALVGHPKRRYAWILGRTAHMDPVLFEEIMSKAANYGYQRKDFRRTDQAVNLQ